MVLPRRMCKNCGCEFEPKQLKTRPREKCYKCSPLGPNTTARITEECKTNVRAYMRQLRQKGRGRLRASKLTIDDLMEIWNRQNGRCALSGIEMTHDWGKNNVWNASPDQIVPASKGGTYEPSNVQFICKLFQFMRMDLDDQIFKDAIVKAADHIRGCTVEK